MKKFKKVIGLFLLLSLAVVLIVRCEKEPLIVTPTQYAIDASTGPGGTFIPKVGKILVEKGKSIAVTPKPDDGYEVESMIVDGEDVTKKIVDNTYTFTVVVSNHTVYATFKKIVMHNVEILPTTGGSVNSSLTQVADGLGIDFTFTSDSGFKPDSVIVNGKSYLLTGNTYHQSNVTTDLKVKGVFAKTNLWYLIQGQWKWSKWEQRTIGAIDWYNQLIPRVDIYVFTDQVDKGQYQFQEYFANNTLVASGPYILKQDSLIEGPDSHGNSGIRHKINLVNETTLVLTHVSKYYDLETGKYVPSLNVEKRMTFTRQ